jgi:hypothetical protein
MVNSPFNPYYGRTVSVASTAGAVQTTIEPVGKQLLLTNVGTVLCFVRIRPNGNTTVASVADLPLPANSQRIITRSGNDSVSQGEVTVDVFSTGAGSTVYITPGEGVGP